MDHDIHDRTLGAGPLTPVIESTSASTSGRSLASDDHFRPFVYYIIMWLIVTIIYVVLLSLRPRTGVVALRDGNIREFIIVATYIAIWSYLARQQWHQFDGIWLMYTRWQEQQQAAANGSGTINESNPNKRYEAAMTIWLVLDMYARAYICWPSIYLMIVRTRDTYRPWCTSFERFIYRTPLITAIILVPLSHLVIACFTEVYVTPANHIVNGIWSCIIWAASVQFGVTRWCLAYRNDHIRRALQYYASGGCDEPIDDAELKHMIAYGRMQTKKKKPPAMMSRVLITPTATMIDTITNILDETIHRYGIIRPISRVIASYYVTPSLIKPTIIHMTRRPPSNRHMAMILDMMHDNVLDRLATELWISRHGFDHAIATAVTPSQFGIKIPPISIPLQLGDDESSSILSRGLQLRIPVRWVRKPTIREHTHDVNFWQQLIIDVRSFTSQLWMVPKRVWPSTANRGYYELDTSSCRHVHAAADCIERNWAAITHLQHWLRIPMTRVTLSHLYDAGHYHHTRVHHHNDPVHQSSALSSWPLPSSSELPIRGTPWSIPYPGSRFDYENPPPMILYVNVTLQCPSVMVDTNAAEPAISVADLPFRLTFDAAYWEAATCCDTITNSGGSSGSIPGSGGSGAHGHYHDNDDSKREPTADLLHRVLVSIHHDIS